ncbi:EamA family transporter [Dokdonia sp. Dokd-P16]|uniref:DMT family transporter n=1 Tax=Dokdonia sp. Dokd-P16 TaxID=2173169 RepID=UPI000D545697|nr:DMT family transporter [Dokdonia sp. Dokd-P16]AWH73139.1 EamA family transporter [Dokdonia sp. Dokd-P16]
MQNDKLKAYLHFHLIVFIWGFTAVLGALITIDAVPLVWFRMGLASIFIFAFIKIRGVSLAVSRKTLVGFAIAGLVIAVHWLTFFGAIKESNVSITLAMMSTGAFFTALLEPIFYKRKVIWYELLFGAIVVGALYVIFEVETAYQTGILLALFSAFLSAVFTLINGKFIENHHPTKISFYELLIGSLCVTVYLVVARPDTFFSAQFFALATMDWVYIGVLSSVCTAYAFIAAVAVMKHLSPYTIMLTINLEPVYGILLAFLVLGDAEQMSKEFYYGALVILAVVIANGVLKNSKKFKAVKEA